MITLYIYKGLKIKKTFLMLISMGMLTFTFNACTNNNYNSGYNNHKNRAYQGREADLALENGRAYEANDYSHSR